LEIQEDQAFQEKIWKIQRIGCIFLFLFVAAAAAGFTGPSEFTKKVEEKNGYRLEYPRFGRIGTSFEIILSGPTGEVFISQEILRKTEMETATPEPERSASSPEGMAFFFENANGEMHFDAKPREAGWVKGIVRLGKPAVELPFRQFVYF
jgi:hypothetical protein